MAKKTFRITHYHIRIEDPAKRPDEPFVIAYLSDLHNAEYGTKQKALFRALDYLKPAAVFSGGDLVIARKGQVWMDQAEFVIGQIAEKYPFYMVNGNHETKMREQADKYGDNYERYLQIVESTSAKLLNNKSEHIVINGTPLQIIGFEGDMSLYSRLKRRILQENELHEKIGDPDPKAYTVLMAHHPDFYDAAAAWGADLMLAGHFHGGIIRLPFLGGLVGGSLRPFPKHSRGHYREKGKELIVGAGLGAHTIKMRPFNPPELIALHFMSS